MWFQVAECNAVNASLLLNLINNNFLIFLTENLPILNPYLPQNLKICDPILVTLSKMRPHYWLIIDYSHSSREDAIPSSSTSPLGSCKGVPSPPGHRFGIPNPMNGPLLLQKKYKQTNRERIQVNVCTRCLLLSFCLVSFKIVCL